MRFRSSFAKQTNALTRKMHQPEERINIASIFLCSFSLLDLELEQIQTQMAQKPVLRAEVYARALRASQNARESGGIGGRAMRLMSGRGAGEYGSGRHSYGGGVISEVGWLSLCGASRGDFVKRRATLLCGWARAVGEGMGWW